MASLLYNTRGHAHPLSLAINAATILIGATMIFFNPKLFSVSGIAIFAAFIIVVQLVHLAVFGVNPVGMFLGAIIIVAAAVVLKLSLGHGNFVSAHNTLIIIGLVAADLIKEAVD